MFKSLSLLFILMFIIVGCKTPLVSEYEVESGSVIAFSPASSEQYIGSPSIAKLPNGKYIASHDFFGPKATLRQTEIYHSVDDGISWGKISELDGQWLSSIFYHQGNLFIMGTSERYGFCVIRRSDDEGKTWTEPQDSLTGILLGDSEYHTAPMTTVIHDGRIWRAMEERNPPENWGVNFLSFVMSAPEGADLLKASSWQATNRLRYNQEWEGRAWLEGNVVITPSGKIENILRCAVDKDNIGEVACVITISPDGQKAYFDSTKGFIEFPGGSKKFSIRYDENSQLYWSLSNYIPKEYEGSDPSQTRNTLALIFSHDLKSWKINKIILHDSDVKHVGYQYVDWLFEDNDIISVIRAAYPESDGTQAHNAHDANHLLFLRIKDFRN